ncbi:lipopolysaccharide biosynthesis protein [Brassicibacter mesophilus]|uniref:lipopolysaccharide biosynthesis protein n=1 Tax=Brassicibacter mesophilus TaxID=745119 RepID=UPI003D1BE6A2
MKAEIKSIINVLSANIIIILIGIVQTFILPSILVPEEYGYWSLYLLYTGYAGFLILGFCDGFYLKYGGEKYEDLDKSIFSCYHWILATYLITLFAIWYLLLTAFLPHDKRYLVFIFIGIGVVLSNQRSFFVLLNQATARFSIYAKGHVIEKISILIIAIICIFVRNVNAFYIIIASVVGKLITLIYFTFFSKDIVLTKPHIDKNIGLSVIDNIKVGFTLTLSGVGGMLMTGFGRFVVEKQLGIVELGYYSLMFSISALFTQLIYAFSTVFFPVFRRVKEIRAKYLLGRFDQLIINLSGIILIIYYPARYLLEIIFPQYHPAMNPMVFLFPIVICQSRMTLVYNTLYKVLRYEKQLLKNVLIALAFSTLVTIVFFNLNKDKESVAFATYLGFLFWNTIARYYYRKKENINNKWITPDIFLSFIYILANLIWGYTVTSFVIISVAVILVVASKIQETDEIIKEFRKSI